MPTILCIDDEALGLQIRRAVLERAGYRVSAHGDARTALDIIRAAPATVDVVVTDFNMPDCSGLDVARELARIRPGLPVVISSGHISEELRRQALALGVRELLEKESTFQALGPAVARVLAAGSGRYAG